MNLREYLKEHILITDGAMGTYYAQLTGSRHTTSETANFSNSEIIEEIHKNYIEAGAQLIRTNTFSANTGALDIPFEQVKKIIQKGYTIAKAAVEKSKKEIYIGASIGPIPENGSRSDEKLLEEYQSIVDTFIASGATVFLFETFSDTKYLKAIIPYIKERQPEATVMAQFALNLYGYTKKGISAKRLLEELCQIKGLDIYGFNCGIGAGHLYQIMNKLNWSESDNLMAMPNSGYPDILQDRMVYMDNADYFVDTMVDIAKLGVRVIGGCCGTTPSHIEKLSQRLSDGQWKVIKKPLVEEPRVSAVEKKVNPFEAKLLSGKKVIAVELDPPFGSDIEKVMEGANLLKAAGVDIITIADSPMGKPRADSIMIASKIRKEVGIPVMPHICCRDKNIIAMKSQILGAYIEGIRNLLLVTGDPIPSSDRNEIKSVFNLNSIQLMQMIKEMNIEHFEADPFSYGGALNPNRPQLDKEIERMKKKIKDGATYFLTQPIYDDETLDKLKYIKQSLNVKILGGILPLVNIRNARFVQNEIPGIKITDEIVQRFTDTMTRDESESVGIQIALEMAFKMKDFVDGYYFMVPFNRVHMINTIIDELKKEGE